MLRSLLNDGWERRDIDPDNRYPVDGLLEFERMARQILQLLQGAAVSRTRDVIQLDYRQAQDPDGLSVLVMREVIELRLPTIEWVGPHSPISASKLWKRVRWQEKDNDWPALIQSAQAAQQKTFGVCQYCKRQNPRGWMHSKTVCQSCTERELGIVH